jgi:hypothetical protein
MIDHENLSGDAPCFVFDHSNPRPRSPPRPAAGAGYEAWPGRLIGFRLGVLPVSLVRLSERGIVALSLTKPTHVLDVLRDSSIGFRGLGVNGTERARAVELSYSRVVATSDPGGLSFREDLLSEAHE